MTAHISTEHHLQQVFICISAVGLIVICIYLPETKGVPLEEVAAIFGDREEVVVFSDDIQADALDEDELVIKGHHEKIAGTDTMKAADGSEHREVTVP